jgi:hypothetical protein
VTLSEWVSYVEDMFQRLPTEERSMRNFITKEVVEQAVNKKRSKVIERELEKEE